MNLRMNAFVWVALWVASLQACLADIQPVSFVDPATNTSVSGNGYSSVSEMSPDGRYVLFESIASNLATNDYNYCADVFLRDRQSGTTTLISVTPDGFSGHGGSFGSSMSTNGAWIVFQSDADDLVSNDTNGTMDIFVRSVVLGQTALVSVNTNGTSANGESTFPMITPDGRFVAFESAATDLVTNVGTNVINVYLRDLSSNSTFLVSIDTNGNGGGNGNSWLSGVSEDGRYVLFTSAANNLGSVKSFGSEIFLRDMQAQHTYWISTNVAGIFRSDFTYKAVCFNPVMSADGQSMAFRVTKGATNLVVYHELPSNTTQVISSNQWATYVQGWDYTGPSISHDGGVVAFMDVAKTIQSGFTTNQIYVWDFTNRTSTMATLAFDGSTPGNASSDYPLLSADGSTLTFFSESTNLVANMPATSHDWLYVRHLDSGNTELIGVATNLDKPQGDIVEYPALSADGSLIAFGSSSDGLVDNDNNGMDDVFVSSPETGITELVSSRSPVLDFTVTSSGSYMGANGLSGDGRYAVFVTAAENLVDGDTNGCWDICVRDILTKKLQLVSGNANGTGTGNGASMQPSMSADGNLVAFQSDASDLVAGDNNKATDVFLRNLATKETRLISKAFVGSGSASGVSDIPVITPDGRFVVFRSRAANLTSSYVSTLNYSLYVYDTATGSNVVFSYNNLAIANATFLALSPNGQFAAFYGNYFSGSKPFYICDLSTHVCEVITNNVNFQTATPVAFSGDGRWLAYANMISSVNTNLIFRDLVAKTNLSIGASGGIWRISINGDGSRVAYETFVPSSTPNSKHQIYVYDRMNNSNLVVSATLGGDNSGNGDSRNPIISWDGRYVYFNSDASDLTADVDRNIFADVFVRDLTAGTTRLLSVNRFKTGSGSSQTVLRALSADGQVVAMESLASDLVPMDVNMFKDVFVVRMNASVEDSDDDGLADHWENQYFGSLEYDGTGDFDGDGMSDGAEYLAGTDPTEKQSAFVVTQIGEPGGTGRVITWAAVPGKTYKVQYKSDLKEGAWVDLEGVVTADAAVASKADETTNGAEQRFYRVVLVP